jgi:hypothetical protein
MERKGIFFRAAAQTEEIARKGKTDIDCAGLCGSHHFEAARRGAHAVSGATHTKLSARVRLRRLAVAKMPARGEMSVCVGATSSGPTHFGHASVFFATSFQFC